MAQVTLHVFSARISSRDPDRLDVTRKAIDVARKKSIDPPDGWFLAPSRTILDPVLNARWADSGNDGRQLNERWSPYVDGYLAEMRVSYSTCGACDGTDPEEEDPDYLHTCDRNRNPRPPAHRPGHFRFNLATGAAWHRGARSARIYWLRLLSRPRVVLVCYCTDPEHCHRYLLRTRILPALGAIDCGEILEAAA